MKLFGIIYLVSFHKIIPSKHSENGNLLLDVPLDMVHIPHWLFVKASEEGYKAKPEYHVTVIGSDLADKIREYGLEEAVRHLVSSFSWTLNITDSYIELAKDDENRIHRQTIICMVEVLELNLFFEELKNLTKFTITIPPAHITLFTKNYDRGIGLYSMDDLGRYKVKELSEKL